MRAFVVTKPGEFGLEHVSDPTPGPYDAVVRMETCGFCNSTDTKLIDGLMDWAPPFPIVLGHESVGSVVEVGPKVKKYAVGDRVTRPVAWFAAGDGRPNAAFGGFAEYGVVRDGMAMAADGDSSFVDDYNSLRQNTVPTDLDAVQGALCISLAETASSMAYMPRVRGKRVVVAGTGIAGLSYTLWAALEGAEVLTIGRRRERLELASRLGARHLINSADGAPLAPHVIDALRAPADLVIDAVGDTALARSLEDAVDDEGATVAYGVPPSGGSYTDRWMPARVEEHEAYPWIARLAGSGVIDLDAFLTHTWAFDELDSLIEQVNSRQILKAIVRF